MVLPRDGGAALARVPSFSIPPSTPSPPGVIRHLVQGSCLRAHRSDQRDARAARDTSGRAWPNSLRAGRLARINCCFIISMIQHNNCALAGRVLAFIRGLAAGGGAAYARHPSNFLSHRPPLLHLALFVIWSRGCASEHTAPTRGTRARLETPRAARGQTLFGRVASAR